MITLSLLIIIIYINVLINDVTSTNTNIIPVLFRPIPPFHSPINSHHYINGSDCAERLFCAKLFYGFRLTKESQFEKRVQKLSVSTGTSHRLPSDCGFYPKCWKVSFPLENRTLEYMPMIQPGVTGEAKIHHNHGPGCSRIVISHLQEMKKCIKFVQ